MHINPALHLFFRGGPPFDGHLSSEGKQGALLTKEGPARRARVPQHQVIDRPAAGQFGGRQGGAQPEPHNAHPRRSVGAQHIDGEPDVPEPFVNQVGIGPAPHRVPRRHVVEPKGGPPRTGETVRQGA